MGCGEGGAFQLRSHYIVRISRIWRMRVQCVPGSLFAALVTHAESLGMRLVWNKNTCTVLGVASHKNCNSRKLYP